MSPSPGSMIRELERMRQEMEQIWDRFSTGVSSTAHEQEWVPLLDLADTGDSLVAEIEVPGLGHKELEISVTEEALTISGDKKKEGQAQEQDCHLLERSYGKFSRTIRLPATVDPNRVEASHKDGVLCITMAKLQQVKAKKIEVKTA